MCTFFHSWRCRNFWPWKDFGSLLGQGPRGHAFLLTSWCFFLVESCVGASAQEVLRKESFSSFLWWVRRFEGPYLNVIKIVNCPFTLMHLFGVCATILLCLDVTWPDTTGCCWECQILALPNPEATNQYKGSVPASFRELWEVGIGMLSREAIVSTNIMFQRIRNLSRSTSGTFSRSGPSAAQRC